MIENADSGSVAQSIAVNSTNSIAWGRIAGIAFGACTQMLFLGTVVYLFLFLRYGSIHVDNAWVFVDSLLAIGFAVPHSLLLAPPIAARIKRSLAPGLMGCLHCTVTCISLLLMFQLWGRSEIKVWHVTGFAEKFVLLGFYGSWIALFYSLSLTGLGYQTGFTQWWYWMLQRPLPKRQFVVIGIYRWMRHPVYVSFLGLIWFTPVMTLDHALLTSIWTVYIYVGSVFKDRRLLKFIGEPYREYATRVPGFPGIGLGSLRRWNTKSSPC